MAQKLLPETAVIIPDEEGGGILTFEYVFDRNGNEKYRDGIKKIIHI